MDLPKILQSDDFAGWLTGRLVADQNSSESACSAAAADVTTTLPMDPPPTQSTFTSSTAMLDLLQTCSEIHSLLVEIFNFSNGRHLLLLPPTLPSSIPVFLDFSDVYSVKLTTMNSLQRASKEPVLVVFYLGVASRAVRRVCKLLLRRLHSANLVQLANLSHLSFGVAKIGLRFAHSFAEAFQHELDDKRFQLQLPLIDDFQRLKTCGHRFSLLALEFSFLTSQNLRRERQREKHELIAAQRFPPRMQTFWPDFAPKGFLLPLELAMKRSKRIRQVNAPENSKFVTEASSTVALPSTSISSSTTSPLKSTESSNSFERRRRPSVLMRRGEKMRHLLTAVDDACEEIFDDLLVKELLTQ